MKFEELADYFANLADNIMADVPEIVAETATAYFKESFTQKAFDGKSWPPAAVVKQTGSLLVESGALLNSIRPSYIGPDKVVISAGNDKVSYAQPHNEGFSGSVTVSGHIRRTKSGPANVSTHSRHMKLPKRQFMGNSKELADSIIARIEAHMNQVIKK